MHRDPPRTPHEDPAWTWRLSLGVTLGVMQLVLGWPAVAVLGSSAAYTGDADLALWGAPGVYALSWLLLGLAVLIGGPDAMRVTRQGTLRLVRVASGRRDR